MLAMALAGLVGLGGSAGSLAALSTGPGAGIAAASLSYEFYDFINVTYGEYWDYRTAIYGDLPVNAECFSAEAIANGICTPSNAAVKDFGPETSWYPLPGAFQPGNPNNNPLIYAPYRFRATGLDIPGYSLSDPVFLPVLNPAAAAGSRLEFAWYMQYLDTATADALGAAGCPVSSFDLDGFNIRSQIQLTMDAQESRRIFGAMGTTQAELQTWWNGAVSPLCFSEAPAEAAFSAWTIEMGGSAGVVGKYDIYNSFEWYYQPFYTQMSATVEADGTTHVSIDHVAWGTEVILARMFYWGAASYKDNFLDSTKALGWWGMELAWFEDFTFGGSFKATAFDFNLDTAMQYHFQLLANGGADGNLDRVGDVPYWTWGPILSDYTNDASARHLISELDRYPSPPYSYVHNTPGSPQYGKSLPYDYAPSTWDLKAGESMHFQFPTSDQVVFYDPNLTPIGANPVLGQYVEVRGRLTLLGTNPASYGMWDPAANTWHVVGPSSTGGPAGTPGADGIPGTADDQYALDPWGAIFLEAGVPPPPAVMSADLIGRSAWPERHHWVQSRDADGMQTLYGKVGNLGNTPVDAAVVFEIRDEAGALVATLQTTTSTIDIGTSSVLSVGWMPTGPGRYRVTAQALYDSDGDGTLDGLGMKVKSFSFAVVP